MSVAMPTTKERGKNEQYFWTSFLPSAFDDARMMKGV